MKRFMLSVALSCLYLANINAADIKAISGAFSKGNAAALSSLMDKEVDMALQGGTSKVRSGSDAEKDLESFFKTGNISGFQVIHHADKKDRGFIVGKINANGKEYRVNITYRTENDKAIIQSIRIE